VAILAAVLAMLVRRALDQFLKSDHVFVLSLLAVVAVAWQGGFGPALVTLVMTLVGRSISSSTSLHVRHHVAQRPDRRRPILLLWIRGGSHGGGPAHGPPTGGRHLADTIRKQAALEAEIARRLEIEVSLRQRERT